MKVVSKAIEPQASALGQWRNVKDTQCKRDVAQFAESA
jgi:hypothetical protein